MKRAEKIKNLLWNAVSCGFPFDHDIEVLRKAVLINLIIIFGGYFLLLLGTVAFIQANYVLTVVDYSIFLFLFWLFFFLRKTKKLIIGSIVGTSATGIFYSFLIAYGGVSNTAHVWAFTYPLIAFFLLGTDIGIVLSLLLLVMACVVFAFGKNIGFVASYDNNLIIRFIPSYVLICLFAFVMEKSRSIVHSRLRIANGKMEEAITELEGAGKEKEKLIGELQQTIQEVKILQRIVPMCARCKKIRNDAGYWEQVEEYIQERSHAQFSHGICPECAKELYSNVLDANK